MRAEKQLAGAPASGPVAARLLCRHAPSLSAWYGDPVSKDAAQTLAASAQSGLRIRLCEGGACFQLHVLILVCNFWMDIPIEMGYEQLFGVYQQWPGTCTAGTGVRTVTDQP